MGRSLIGKDSLSRSLIDFTAIQRTQVTIAEKTQKKAITSINSQKSELIQIMNDYLTQKITRIDTTSRLNKLQSKIA